MRGKIQDVILLLVVTGLVIAALLPVDGSEEEEQNSQADEVVAQKDDAGTQDSKSTVAATSKNKSIDPGAAKPATNTLHHFMPLVAGSEWIYRVDGTEDFIEDETWTLKLDTVPTAEAPGKARAGFGDTLNECSVFASGETISLNCLPFVEPLMFRGNRPTSTTGAFLQDHRYAIEGAVWKQYFERNVEYESPDKNGKIHIQNALGTQSDRAIVSGNEQTIVPAGIFDSIRIDWIGRIELWAGKRKVLAKVTSEPFRTESTWFASGIGMLRRRVEYSQPERTIISFDLVRYSRP